MTDDLRREYVRVYMSSPGVIGTPESEGPKLEVFVPRDYPFDQRVPNRLTLVLQNDEQDPSRGPEEIATLQGREKDWKQDAPWPAELLAPEKLRARLPLANALSRSKDWPRLERLVAAGSPDDRERFHLQERLLSALRQQNERAEAMALAEQMMKVVETNTAKGEGSPFDCNSYLSLLLESGRKEEAAALAEKYLPLMEKAYAKRENEVAAFGPALAAIAIVRGKDAARDVFRRLEKIEPEKRHKHDNWEEDFNSQLWILASDLSHKAHLPVEDVGYILGADVKKDKRFERFRGWDWNPEQERNAASLSPGKKLWKQHFDDIVAYYQTHPLPERMELLPRKIKPEAKPQDGWMYTLGTLDIPGLSSRQAWPLNGRLRDAVSAGAIGLAPDMLSVPEDIGNIQLSHDVICKAGTPYIERRDFLLDQLGLELAGKTEMRKVWVARYDGRPLKPARMVSRPADVKDISGGAPMTMADLLRHLMMWRNSGPKPENLYIVDETGLRSLVDSPGDRQPVVYVSNVSPWWQGEGGTEKARAWFQENFGVTFTEETRPITVYVIQKKAAAN